MAESNFARRNWKKYGQKLIQFTRHNNQKAAETSDMLRRRVREVRTMSKQRCEIAPIILCLSKQQKKFVEDLTNVNSVDWLRGLRQNWKLIEHFRHAARMVLLIGRGFNTSRKRYYHADTMVEHPVDNSNSDIFVHVDKSHNTKTKPDKQTMALKALMALTTQPNYRSHQDILSIVWMIRTVKEFRYLFPDDMEYDLARCVMYERYDDGRVLAYQDCVPERFYFIMSGKLSLLHEYQLENGTVTKIVGERSKHSCLDQEDLEQGWNRQNHLVTKSGVELLSLGKIDYIRLTKKDEGLPLEFLKEVDMFKEVDLEQMSAVADTIQCHYYSREKVIVEDVGHTPWIHIIKSGTAKVLRKQPVIDLDSCRHVYKTRSEKKPWDPLGMKIQYTSHANAMLGLSEYQKKSVTKAPDTLSKTCRKNSSSSARNADKPRDLPKWPSLDSIAVCQRKRTLTRSSHTHTLTAISKIKIPSPVFNSSPLRLKSCVGRWSIKELPFSEDNEIGMHLGPWRSSTDHKIINIPVKGESPTRGDNSERWRRLMEKKLPRLVCRDINSERKIPERLSYIQLDQLHKYEIFGLQRKDLENHLLGLPYFMSNNRCDIMLVSDGAEVVRVNKEAFLRQVTNNTILKVDTAFKEYMSRDEAKEVLYQTANWRQYKYNNLQQTLKTLRISRSKTVI